jgi:hypothetical protein
VIELQIDCGHEGNTGPESGIEMKTRRERRGERECVKGGESGNQTKGGVPNEYEVPGPENPNCAKWNYVI